MLDLILGKDIARYVKRHKKLLVLAMLLTAASSLFVVVPAYLLQPFVDEGMKTGTDPVAWKIPWVTFEPGTWWSWKRTERVIVEGISPNHLLFILTLVAFVSVLLKSITVYFGEISATAFSNRAVRSLRIDLFRKFVSLPLSFYHKRRSGELIARATADLTVMQSAISSVIIGLIQHPLTAIVFLAYLLFMNYQLTLLVFVAVPVILGIIRLFGRKVKKHAVRVQDATAEVTSAYQEMLVCLKVVHGFFKGERETARFKELADNLYRRIMRWARWNIGVGPMLDATVFLVLPAVLMAGKIYFHHTLGELMSMIYAFSRVYSPIKRLAKILNSLRTLQGATTRVFAIMNTEPDIRDRPGAVELGRHRDSIRFEDVHFAYRPEEPVLRGVSFEVKAGQMVAFVGSTGAGKSTLLDLVPRFYDVTQGAVTIDGLDVREVTLDSLRRQIGIVSQEVLLFHKTIAANIAFGADHVDMDRVVEAARAAHAHDFIMAQPKGYDTVVGDRGTLLSGGQRQRIAIARAILIRPSILILDEAASALDAESERYVQAAIESLHGGPTILVVAHRLSTILKADLIHVLENGKIVESGTLHELLSAGGRFRDLYDMQFSKQT
ncbi:MAG: ABC transporter ATP-binding protein [Deltaproteobacteria bacterium]|nr:ABC transporter ATP-binding protein [Deltaproteobacteria bacterium]MBW1923431.1 ABC transporter ATP-binding protein [Deltaproteobacteria bacterium]MBW1948843.1 ABC transporter ATP-binding protein [Deltaproteobacteria bacterium]MBW2008945.1 ABC transporter ATP-binding protein [Deltaproteobacteria bacterium]MBW2103101.1 ABC transporter ATP-binding protein [Deltaproteobacteria bacterium]